MSPLCPQICDRVSALPWFSWLWQIRRIFLKYFVECFWIGIFMMIFSWWTGVMGLGEEHDGAEVPFLPYHVGGVHDSHMTPRVVITFITWLRWNLPDRLVLRRFSLFLMASLEGTHKAQPTLTWGGEIKTRLQEERDFIVRPANKEGFFPFPPVPPAVLFLYSLISVFFCIIQIFFFFHFTSFSDF